MDRHDEIRARCEAATPGPWTYYSACGWGAIEDANGDDVCGGDPGEGRIEPDDPNCVFICHAREDVPYLLDEVERLGAEAACLRSERDQWQGRFEGIKDCADVLAAGRKNLLQKTQQLTAENERLRAEFQIIKEDGLCNVCEFIDLCTDPEDCCFKWRYTDAAKGGGTL